jgi:hypothetical protein
VSIGDVNIDYIQTRPYAIQLILNLFNHFDILLFTTGTADYAGACCQTYLLFVDHTFVGVFNRQDAMISNKLFHRYKHSKYIKSKLPNQKLIGIDDMAPENMDYDGYFKIYKVKPWYGDTNDRSLKFLWKQIKYDFLK